MSSLWRAQHKLETVNFVRYIYGKNAIYDEWFIMYYNSWENIMSSKFKKLFRRNALIKKVLKGSIPKKRTEQWFLIYLHFLSKRPGKEAQKRVARSSQWPELDTEVDSEKKGGWSMLPSQSGNFSQPGSTSEQLPYNPREVSGIYLLPSCRGHFEDWKYQKLECPLSFLFNVLLARGIKGRSNHSLSEFADPSGC